MAWNLEIPIFTTDAGEHDARSFERSGCRDLISLCREINSGGGQRVRFELNAVDSYDAGGLTPNIERTIKFLTFFRNSPLLTEAQQPVFRIMIRPRGSKPDRNSPFRMERLEDFQYSEDELTQMHDTISQFKKLGADLLSHERGDGFVFGCLKRVERRLHGLVLDSNANGQLISLASPYPCILHRAFDAVLSTRNDPDIYGPPQSEIPPSSVEELIDQVKGIGFKGVLTSGGWGNAELPSNLMTLTKLGQVALRDDGFQLIVGGGVRNTNLWRIQQAMGRKQFQHPDLWLHSSLPRLGAFDANLARSFFQAMRQVAEF
ncbi:copper homeostasis CutC domain-containing protein [Sordaria brevicollis]|uniref:Copper homeostasis protein cutC homolog n=1 Tax=Sordaria brevicollis TaxID=83679 RepID=A0AAE0UGN7_SORBR|nr:copper homeostasis CutC domain-containing protein [Sordaria brevicollis]